jgi:hypothetical protein
MPSKRSPLRFVLAFLPANAAATALLAACGGTSATIAPPAPDSGSPQSDASQSPDGSDGGPTAAEPDAFSEAAPEGGPQCVPDADLTMISLPDGSGGDSGVDVSACLACIRSTCAAQLTACSADCTCQVGIDDFVACLSGSTDPRVCALRLVNGVPTSLPVAICVGGVALGGTGVGCLIQCGAPLPPGVEAGSGTAPEAGGDAPAGG